jgi:hypothetical protein
MRKEAKLEQWRGLYDIAIKIKELKPWEYLWDLDVITIVSSYEKEPYYCSIMGRGGECFAIGTYVGFDAINDFYKIVDNKDIPQEQLIRYQNNMMCFFGNRDDLTRKEYKVIKDLGLKFRGKNNWIYFEKFQKGYEPYILDEQQVVELTEVFKHLYMALKAINKGLKVDFEAGNTLLRRYDEETKLWINYETPAIIPQRKYRVPVLQDEILVARLNKQKIIDEKLEIDIAYLNSVINDKKYDKPIITRMCILADCRTEAILGCNILTPDDEDVDTIFNMLINYIMKIGKPKTIIVRDEYIQSLLSDICERINVGLKIKGRLKAIDTFIEAFSKRMSE